VEVIWSPQHQRERLTTDAVIEFDTGCRVKSERKSAQEEGVDRRQKGWVEKRVTIACSNAFQAQTSFLSD